MNKGFYHAEETKRKISESLMNHYVSDITREKMRLSHIGKYPSREMKEKNRQTHLGITKKENSNLIRSEGTRRKISRILKKQWQNGIRSGHKHTEKTKRKISLTKKQKPYRISKEVREKLSQACKGISKSKEHKRKISNAHKGKIKTEEHLRAIFAGWHTTPNKLERKLRSGLNKMFPGEYKFVGDGKTFIGGKCPDFINVNGQKKIIELFGDYWHSEKITGQSKIKHEQQRTSHFAKYGFQTLIIWERELKNIPQLKKKLIKFHKGVKL